MSGKKLVYYGLWCWPDSRWLTGWDFVRDKANPLADALVVFLNVDAAMESSELLPEALRKCVVAKPFDLNPKDE